MKVCWNLTNLCNEDCLYCFRDLYERPISLSNNLAIIRKLKYTDVTSITYAGGEPFLYKDLKDLLSYAQAIGIENCLITNGTLLNEDNLDDYLPYVSKITFSIDSPNSYVNDKIGRGKEHYEHIKHLIPIIHAKYPNVILEINSVATKPTYDEVDYMFEAMGREISFKGVSKWKISRFCPLRGYAKERDKIFGLSDHQFMEIRRKYDGGQAEFEISVRDFNEIYSNNIISPRGSLKRAEGHEEYTVVEDILAISSKQLKKKISGV